VLIRSLGIAITIAALSWPLSCFSLGLGEIIVESTLASPLKASIPLNGMDRIDLDPDQFFIRLDGFSKPKIRYRLERIDTETARIILYTRKAITEPLFQFRIEVEWDEGIVARRYDVLIDPPSYLLNTPVEVITTSVPGEISGSLTEPVATDPPAASSVVETTVTRSVNHTGEPGSPPMEPRRQYGPIGDGDSIWRVAKKVATGNKELSIYQWMYGIWQANPQAFARSNMHRLRIYEFISVPYEWEVAEIPRGQAYQTYARHLALFETAIENRETVVGDDSVAHAVVGSAPKVANEKMVFEEIPTAVTEEPPVTNAAVNIDQVSASVVVNPSHTPAAEVLKEGEVILDLIEVLDTGDQPGIILVGAGTDIEVPAVQGNTNDESQAEWAGTLEKRGDFIEQLPVIGSEAPLAIVGRALQQTDEFVSSRPSWWVMAFGVWVTLVILMLSYEFRSRPGLMRDLKQRVVDLVLGVFTTRESIQVSAGVEYSLRSLAADNESNEPGSISPDVDEVIAAADVIVANGNTDEAVDLLEATMDIQPDQGLTIHLLEAYYKAGDAKSFETLVRHFESVISEMDTSEQVYLQAMYSELCPNTTHLIDQGYLVDPNIAVPAIPLKPERPEEEARPHIGASDATEGPVESDLGDDMENDEPEDDFLATQVVVRDNETEVPVKGAGVGQQDDTLDETDIYLAYGLYDNAEDLLMQSMEARPGRADYTSKLLDTYFATRNTTEFIRQAEALKAMGDAAGRYWDRVQVMGYELAPDNEMFSGARGSSLSASDLGITKPEAADIDLGSEIEDDGSIAETDILLSGEPDDLVDVDVDTQTFIETVARDDEVGEDEEEAPVPGAAADGLSDPEIAFDEEEVESIEMDRGATGVFELPDDVDSSLDDAELVYSLDVDYEEKDSESEDLSSELSEAEEIEFDPLDSAIFDLPDDIDAGDEESTSEPENLSLELSGAEEIEFEPLDSGVFDLPEDFDTSSEENNTDLEDALMETSRAEETDFGQFDSDVSVDGDEAEPVENLVGNLEDGVDSKSFDGRILYFPDSHGNYEKSGEFESQVKMTLQSIRDQMQQINERMFSQERDSNSLKKAIGELNDSGNFQPHGKRKKSK